MEPTISLVIPCHNEALSLQRVVEEAAAALEFGLGPGWEIVVVDDGSTDGSLALLGRLGKAVPGLRTVIHKEQRGKSAALWSGIVAARSAWIATMDGDGQHDAADIACLVHTAWQLRRGSTNVLVCGRRAKRDDECARRVASWVANRMLAGVLNLPITDNGSGMKVFGRQPFLALPKFQGMHRFLPALFRRAGAPIAHETITVRPRSHGRSHYTVRARALRGAFDLSGVVWLMFRWLPVPDALEALASREAATASICSEP